MTELSEDRVYARHRRRTGAVLIIGAGAVGGFLAEELARLGFSPIRLVDCDVLEVGNLVRHPLGAQALGQPKATALASKIRRDFPVCDAKGLDEDFLLLPEDMQRRVVDRADLVVAATDTVECQQRVNEVCLYAEKPAVYPAVWVDERVRDAEVGEILWVLPGRHTPCYLCATAWRQGAGDAQARGGTRADIQILVLATAQVVAGLLDRTDAPAGLLDPDQTCIYVHGFSPPSPAVRNAFQGPGLQSRAVHVPFPATPCPTCGGHEPTHAPTPRLAPHRPPAATQPPPPPLRRPSPATPLWHPPSGFTAPPVRRSGRNERLRSALATSAWPASAVLLIAAILGFWAMGSHAGAPPSSAHGRHAAHRNRPKHVAIPPTHTRLICDRRGSSAYAKDGNDCTSGNMYNPDTITLEVRGLTHHVVRVLCKRGYRDEWTSRADPWISRLNEQKYLGASGMCGELRDQNLPTGTHGYLEAEISNPGVLGKDTVTWRLRSPSGKVILKARYSIRVLETEFSGKTPS